MSNLIRINNKLMTKNNKLLTAAAYVPPTPSLPSDMDFIYLANNFDGTKIVNKAINSTFGDYLVAGTITLNDSGSTAYLSNNLDRNNYLYKDLTSSELDLFKAIDNTYTYFIRAMQTSGGTGGIVSFRYNNESSYVYMIRCVNNQLQIHTTSGNNLGSNFSLTTDNVYKVVVNGSTFYAKNLDTDADTTISYSTNRNMSSRMTSFRADSSSSYGNEAYLDRFYALAGIARATTDAEDAIIKDVLMNQSI